MEFKIDTKDTFSTIMPVSGQINAKMADELISRCKEMRQSGSVNIIVDWGQCTGIEGASLEKLVTLHEESYAAGQSLVFTGINEAVMATIKNEEADLLINIAPTMREAIDIVSMEILERDLLGEE